jgi:hypothetical protein
MSIPAAIYMWRWARSTMPLQHSVEPLTAV